MLKFIGGTLLIVGTSIGAGILALPVATAQSGFIDSSIMLFFCWLMMTTAALMILEVNLWFPEDSNMISMAKHTLGLPGEVIAWITYLLLLYALLCAYIAGGTDVFSSLLDLIGIHTRQWLDTVLFTVILGTVVYCGITATDYVNRGLMVIKLSSFVILTGLITPHVMQPNLSAGQAHYLPSAIMVMITSFGFATIIPSLRSYFKSHTGKLRAMIILGSFIPLICYLAWDLAILGTLPLDGNNGLIGILNSGHVTSELMNALQQVINKTSITQLSRLFTSICVLTSFLGVALCLTDFLSDGFKIVKQGWGRTIIAALTFLPPLVIVLFFPGMFIRALTYAGICCVVLLVVLPTLMILSGVSRKNLTAKFKPLNNRFLLILCLLVGLGLLGLGIEQTFWGNGL
jgi:tyrosine-specific transport protein